jgi:hypothetical protein
MKKSAEQPDISKKKLPTEKRVITPGKQEELDAKLADAISSKDADKVKRLLKAGATISANELELLIGNPTMGMKLTEVEKLVYRETVKRAFQKYYKRQVGDSEIEYIDEGASKAVYKIGTEMPILAIAASRYMGEEFEGEFEKLRFLHEKCPDHFPRPIAVIEMEEGNKVIFMDYLDFQRINKFKEAGSATDKEMAAAIGYAVGYVFAKTGMFTKEPHDGNILLKKDGNGVRAKFVDVDHFENGNISELIFEYFLNNSWARTECIKNRRAFEGALERGIKEGHSA